MQKFKLTATIPTVQYGNIMPEIEVEAETYEQAEAIALRRMEAIWSQYAEPGKQLRKSNRVKLEAFVGGSIYYDESKHEYSNEAGDVYLSGSAYAHQFEEPFDQAGIAAAMAKKYGVSADDIIKMWELKAQISRDLGTSLHAAMELYGRYEGLAKKMERSANHDNPMVMEAVKQFYSERKGDEAYYEALVVDHEHKRAGRIDRLVRHDLSNIFTITDFKTDVNIAKRLPTYQKQLSFYAAIIEAAGHEVAGLILYHWDGTKWTTYNLDKEAV